MSDLGVLAQKQQAIDIGRQAQLGGRAQHALGFDAANFSHFDGQRGFACFGRKSASRQDERHLVARLKILRTANDLALALAVVDAAERKLVGIRMLVAGDDLGDDDAVHFSADFFHPFDFQSEQGQAPGQFFRGPIEADILLEPVKSNFHSEALKLNKWIEAPLSRRQRHASCVRGRR